MDNITSFLDTGPVSGLFVVVVGCITLAGVLIVKYGEEFNLFVNTGFVRQTIEASTQVEVGDLIIVGRVSPAVQSSQLAAAEKNLEDANHSINTKSGASDNQDADAHAKILQQVEKLGAELDGSKKTIYGLTEENSKLRKRCRQLTNIIRDSDLMDQAKTQLERQGSSRFEDLSLGENRPSVLVRRYTDLYSESRMEAWEAIDDCLPDMSDIQKDKLLFSVVVISFKNANQCLEKIKSAMRRLLGIDANRNIEFDAILEDMDASVSLYFRKSLSQRDYTDDFQLVTSEVGRIAGPGNNSALKDCDSLNKYIWDCMQLAWALTVQTPRYVIKYDFVTYDDVMHTKFHTSNPDSLAVKMVLWPALWDEQDGVCLSKSVVIT